MSRGRRYWPQTGARQAVATVFGGIALSAAMGVPLGTVIGQWLGWSATFVAISTMAVVALAAAVVVFPDVPNAVRTELLESVRRWVDRGCEWTDRRDGRRAGDLRAGPVADTADGSAIPAVRRDRRASGSRLNVFAQARGLTT